MPVLDMPLKELKKYQGCSVKPDDFDAYWDRALDEMHSTKSNLQLDSSSYELPNTKFYDVWFTGVNNARIHARYAKPENTTGKIPLVVWLHGYSGAAPDWDEYLRFTALGMAVVALDVRGQGGISEDSGGAKGTTLRGHIIRGLEDHEDKLLFRDIYLDTAQLTELMMAMDDIDETRVATYGGSQGGALSLVCASLVPSIQRVVTSFPFLSDFQRVWNMDLSRKGAYFELSDFFRHHDPLHENMEKWYRRLGYIDIQNLVDRINGKVLFAATLLDDICPPSTQFAAYNKITAPKDMLIYHDFAHEHLPGWTSRAIHFIAEMVAQPV
ncbi:Cephalosporin-C deacetylase [Poriferisphaera corsica]|uniref:Cephalosporin-C deacetylase n=1 Tax=Poriferisphaera corsica TaxID=2528020 RepID=A0A517YPX6_9BACT|nr:acetylxylan esterase [Poriferisphaera corsica]QDU32268.1 Cephalosporin-C deacetylase [Poriferisphaera corsica]